MRRSPQDTDRSVRQISRRGLLVGGMQLGFAGLLLGRMHHLQVDEADRFRTLAEENRIDFELITPARGLIFDRKGVLLAGNEQTYRVVIKGQDMEDSEALIARLERLLRLDPRDLEEALRKAARNPADFVTLADRVTWEELSRIAVNAPALPGIRPEVGLSRIYPLDSDFAHIVGYVGRVTDRDLERAGDQDQLLRQPRFQIGKTGVEARAEHDLRGSAGLRQVEKNAYGRVMRELSRQEGRAGANVQLTVNHALQNYVQARLAGESASAVVLNPRTGDILALGSAPSFDPNLFVHGISSKDYAGLRDNPYNPLFNKAASGLYPPGSTFKMVTALAGLEAGLISPEEKITCKGHIELHNRKFHCWKRAGHGRTDMVKSLRESCDVYYYELAQRVGVEKISEMGRRLGLGHRPDVPITGIKGGVMPTKPWKLQSGKGEWVVGDSLNASIGQGFVLTTPLELAVMTARIASGMAISPRLIRSVNGVETPIVGATPLPGISPDNLAIVREGMYEVVNATRGTARSSRIAAEGLRMAGKTGTSQVRNITAAERARGVSRNEDLPWERRDHALFVGYAPHDAPEIVVSVVVEHGGGGSTAAAPIARDILLQAHYDKLPPLSAYPRAQRNTIRSRQQKLDLRPPQAPSEGRVRS